MATKSILPVLIVGGLVVGGILAYKAISNSDDTAGFISGTTGEYIDEPATRIVALDIRQAGRTERTIYRQDTAKDVIENVLDTGESVFNSYTDFKSKDNEDRRDTRVEIKDIKLNEREDRAEDRQSTRLTRQSNRIDARDERRDDRQERISDRRDDRRERRRIRRAS